MHIITALRHYMGCTQAKLAELAGISYADLNEMENKPPYGSIEKYRKLAAALHVDVDLLITNDFLRLTEDFFNTYEHVPFLKPAKAKRALLGRQGEDEVFQMEQRKVSQFHPILPKLVLPYYKMRNHPGFDILSFNEAGQPVYIEVKTTESDNSGDFTLTRHEHDVAVKYTNIGQDYLIYVFTGWDTDQQRLHIHNFKTLHEENRVKPTNYLCDIREISTTVNGIQYFRTIHGYTQAQVCEILDIPKSCLCKYESGENACPVPVYIKLSEFFKVSIEQLLREYPNPELGRNYLSPSL